MCVAGSEGGSQASVAQLSSRSGDSRLWVSRLYRRTLFSLEIVYGSASADRLRSPREVPSMTRDAVR